MKKSVTGFDSRTRKKSLTNEQCHQNLTRGLAAIDQMLVEWEQTKKDLLEERAELVKVLKLLSQQIEESEFKVPRKERGDSLPALKGFDLV